MDTAGRLDGFAEALRHWRGQRGMSQAELALAADTTQRHLSFVETGRSQPGRGMVIRLAEALGLSLRARNALLLAAGHAPVYRETPLDDPALQPVRKALERILEGHQPYPAVIVDRHGDLVNGNAAFWDLTDGVAPELLQAPLNVPRMLLHPRGLAPRIVNLDTWAWHVIEALAREQERQPDERRAGLLAELRGTVTPRQHATAADYMGVAVPLRLRSPQGELRFVTTLTHFGNAEDITLAELRLEAFLPADEATAALLAQARAGHS